MEHSAEHRTGLSATVDARLDGQRLDRALEALLPDTGLRQRRRLIEGGRVLVGGRPAPAGLRLREGQSLSVLPEAQETTPPAVPILVRTGRFAALDKPAGLNSARLAGGGGPSLEALLPELFPGAQATLLNRLDRLTSGIVLAALDAAAEKRFAALPPEAVLKEYLAVVEGGLAEGLCLKRKLDTEDRKRTRVLGKLDPDSARWTWVEPLSALPGGRTLLRVRIRSGARHQIRAHLAAAGLPILGDPLYGEGAEGLLHLHHARLEFPGFHAASDPAWLAGLGPLARTDGNQAGGAPAASKEEAT